MPCQAALAGKKNDKLPRATKHCILMDRVHLRLLIMPGVLEHRRGEPKTAALPTESELQQINTCSPGKDVRRRMLRGQDGRGKSSDKQGNLILALLSGHGDFKTGEQKGEGGESKLPQLLICKARKRIPPKCERLCSHLAFSRRGSLWAWACEAGFVPEDREGCEIGSWALQTIAEPHASHIVPRRSEGSGGLRIQLPSIRSVSG